MDGIGPLIGPILFLAFLGWLGWALMRRRRGGLGGRPVSDAPVGTPYHVYTRDFDRVVVARDAPELMMHANRDLPPAQPPGIATWPARIAAVERLAATAGAVFEEGETILVPALMHMRGDCAVMLLIDQSGSMRDNILPVAAAMRWLSGLFDANAVPLAIAGFTTLGWRGGEPRRRWAAAGRPKRPGRLCALLHIRYRDFDAPMADEDWRAMIHPAVLCENIDGEAIEWAVGELARRPERDKVLVVLSDGAPVDDSTLNENGGGFLVRHVRQIIADTEAAGVVRLGAVGIEFRVNEYYARSTDAADLARLPLALATQIADLANLDSPSQLAEPS